MIELASNIRLRRMQTDYVYLQFCSDAVDWATNHRRHLPIDSRPLRGVDVTGMIKIARGTPIAPDSAVLDSIKVGDHLSDSDIPIRIG